MFVKSAPGPSSSIECERVTCKRLGGLLFVPGVEALVGVLLFIMVFWDLVGETSWWFGWLRGFRFFL